MHCACRKVGFPWIFYQTGSTGSMVITDTKFSQIFSTRASFNLQFAVYTLNGTFLGATCAPPACVLYTMYSCVYAPATCEHRLSAMGRWSRAALRGQVSEPERLHLLRHAVFAELHHLVEPSQQLAAFVLRALYANVLLTIRVYLSLACSQVCAPGLLSNDQLNMWPLPVLIWNNPTNNGMASLSYPLRAIRVSSAALAHLQVPLRRRTSSSRAASSSWTTSRPLKAAATVRIHSCRCRTTQNA